MVLVQIGTYHDTMGDRIGSFVVLLVHRLSYHETYLSVPTDGFGNDVLGNDIVKAQSPLAVNEHVHRLGL